MEYAHGGELFSYINERGKLSEQEAQFVFQFSTAAPRISHFLFQIFFQANFIRGRILSLEQYYSQRFETQKHSFG